MVDPNAEGIAKMLGWRLLDVSRRAVTFEAEGRTVQFRRNETAWIGLAAFYCHVQFLRGENAALHERIAELECAEGVLNSMAAGATP